MADTKITALTEDTAATDNDFLVIVDVADTSMAASGTTKKVKRTNLGLPRVLFVQTATATVTNTTSETTLASTGVGSLTIPAGFFAVGRSIRITAGGLSSNVAGGYTMTLRIKFGSTVILTTAAVALNPSSGTNRGWRLDAVITCTATGGSGSVIGQGMNMRTTSTGGGSPYELVGSATTIDTTASQAVDLTAQYAVANASNVLTCTNFVLEALN